MTAQPLHELWEGLLPPERRWLGLLVLISLAGHLGCFFIFKVETPPSAGVPQRPQQVTLLSAGGADMVAAGSMVWMDWRDPSVMALPRSPLPELSRISSLPEWKQKGPESAPLPQQFREFVLKDDIASLSQQVSDSLKELKPEPKGLQIETPPPLSGTVVQITGALTDRAIQKKTELPQPAVDRDLKTTVLSFSVNEEGMIENILVDSSCEDSSVDQLAVRELRNWKFAPVADTPTQWGKALIYWHFKEKPAPAAPPAP